MDSRRSSNATITSPPMVAATADPSPAISALSMARSDSNSSLATSIGEPAIAGKDEVPAVAVAGDASSSPGGVEGWAHRGNVPGLPENTLVSMRAALAAGVTGIETDLHVTPDGKVVCFHDPDLSRTTKGTGLIHDMPWEGVLEHVRTKGRPEPIPLFSQVLDLLMQPQNMHASLNIDLKVENNPAVLFPLIKSLVSAYPSHATLLSPRIILGIWHPSFILPAQTHLPQIPLYNITMDIPRSREFFFPHVQGISIWFDVAVSEEGAKFRELCMREGKKLTVWTVNSEKEMKEVMRWPGVQAIITDKPQEFLELKKKVKDEPKVLEMSKWGQAWLPYSNLKYYSYWREAETKKEHEYLERVGGAFKVVDRLVL